jgi:hypothetical protein
MTSVGEIMYFMLRVNMRYGELGKKQMPQTALILLYTVVHCVIYSNDSV